MTLFAHKGRCPRCGSDPAGSAAFHKALEEQRAATQAPAPAPLTVPGGPDWLLPGDVVSQIAYVHRVTAGAVQDIAKAVHQLKATQAPAVNDAARMQWLAVHFPEVRLWFLEGQSRWGVENVPGAWNTLREAVDAALSSRVPVQNKEQP